MINVGGVNQSDYSEPIGRIVELGHILTMIVHSHAQWVDKVRDC